MFGFFKTKNKIEEVRKETKLGFETVKKDIFSVGEWIKHLDSEKKVHKKDLDVIKSDLSSMKEEIDELKTLVSTILDLNTNSHLNGLFKSNKPLLNKQTYVSYVQTGIQTGIQTPNLKNFSVTERAILLVLLNTDMKLSYEDLAAMMNKEKSTIRGQINSIKSKSEGLIEETVEKNGKKRVFIPLELKEKILKKQKVRIKPLKNKEENQKKEGSL